MSGVERCSVVCGMANVSGVRGVRVKGVGCRRCLVHKVFGVIVVFW